MGTVEQRFSKLTFPLVSFKEDNPKDQTYILGDCEDMLAEIDELILEVNQIYGSRFLVELRKQTSDKRKDILTL